jgi:hypothetical protein
MVSIARATNNIDVINLRIVLSRSAAVVSNPTVGHGGREPFENEKSETFLRRIGGSCQLQKSQI